MHELVLCKDNVWFVLVTPFVKRPFNQIYYFASRCTTNTNKHLNKNKNKHKKSRLLSITFYHFLSLSVTFCYFLLLSVTFCHSALLSVTLCHFPLLLVTLCHFLYNIQCTYTCATLVCLCIVSHVFDKWGNLDINW